MPLPTDLNALRAHRVWPPAVLAARTTRVVQRAVERHRWRTRAVNLGFFLAGAGLCWLVLRTAHGHRVDEVAQILAGGVAVLGGYIGYTVGFTNLTPESILRLWHERCGTAPISAEEHAQLRARVAAHPDVHAAIAHWPSLGWRERDARRVREAIGMEASAA